MNADPNTLQIRPDEYVRIEQKIGHTFRNKFRIAEVKQLIAEGYQPKNVQSWAM